MSPRVSISQLALFAVAAGCASQSAKPPTAPAPNVAAPNPTAPASPALPPPVGESPQQTVTTPPLVVPAPTSPAAAPPAPRTTAAILSDAIKAMGGEAAFAAHKTRRMKVEIVFQHMGITGTGEQLSTSDDKMVMTTDLPGIGTLREGTNGKVFWGEDPINGLRVVKGAEAEQLRQAAAWCVELRAKDLFKSIEVKNEVGPGGAPLECLLLTPREGSAITNCYDASTHLQVLQKGTHSTPQGETPFLSALRDWRDAGGIKMAYVVDTQEGPLTFTLRITDVKYDEPMPDSLFEMPGNAGAAPAKAPAKTKAPAKKK